MEPGVHSIGSSGPSLDMEGETPHGLVCLGPGAWFIGWSGLDHGLVGGGVQYLYITKS